MVCDAGQVCGCWQKVNLGICSAVTQRSRNSGRGVGGDSALRAAQQPTRSFFIKVFGFCLGWLVVS